MLTIIHPSRSRSKKACFTALEWIEKSGLPPEEIEYIFSIDNDDPENEMYPRELIDGVSVKVVSSDNKNAIQAINRAARHSRKLKEEGDFLIVVSDDFSCFKNWGIILKDLVKGQTDWILKTQDGIQDWIITLPIMDWPYYWRTNYIYHPDYAHAFSDTEMTCVAELTGRLITSGVMFKHNHYSVTGAQKDKTAEKADSYFEQGRQVFLRRAATLFDLENQETFQFSKPNIYTIMVGQERIRAKGFPKSPSIESIKVTQNPQFNEAGRNL